MNIFKSRKEKKRKKVWGFAAGILAGLLTGIAFIFPFGREASESEEIPEEPAEEEPLESRVPSPGPRDARYLMPELESLVEIVGELGDEPIERHSEIEGGARAIIEVEPRDKGGARKKPCLILYPWIVGIRLAKLRNSPEELVVGLRDIGRNWSFSSPWFLCQSRIHCRCGWRQD